MSLGKFLYQTRKQKKQSRASLAKELDTTSWEIAKWENNITFPSDEMIPKLAKVWSLSPDAIYAERAESQSQSTRLRFFINMLCLASVPVALLSCIIGISALSAFLILGNSEEKLRIFIFSIIAPLITGIILYVLFSLMLKNTWISKYRRDIISITWLTLLLIGFIFMLAVFLSDFPNGYSPLLVTALSGLVSIIYAQKRK